MSGRYFAVVCDDDALEVRRGFVEDEEEVFLVHDVWDVVDDQTPHVAARDELDDAVLDAAAGETI